jgi:hypothetical protein
MACRFSFAVWTDALVNLVSQGSDVHLLDRIGTAKNTMLVSHCRWFLTAEFNFLQVLGGLMTVATLAPSVQSTTESSMGQPTR